MQNLKLSIHDMILGVLSRGILFSVLKRKERKKRECIDKDVDIVLGWELRISRIRRLQLALDYLKFDEIEK